MKRTDPLNLPDAERLRPVELWLRGRLRREGWFQLFEGSFYAAIALACLAVVTFIISLLVNGMFTVFGGEQSGGGSPTTTVQSASLIIGLVVLLCIRGYFLRTTLGFVEPRQKIPPEMDNAGIAAIYSAVFSGPGLFMAGVDNFIKCWRLFRCELTPLTRLVVWLYQQHSKTTVEEIMESLPVAEAVKLIPQLRLIPGVIWLESGHGAVILSADLRNSLVAVLIRKRIRLRINIEPPPPKPEGEPSFGRPVGGDPEVIKWYLALNLQPFATLDQVKKRYRQLVKIHHPDARAGVRPGTRINSDEQILRINEAYHNIISQTKGGLN